MKKLTTFFAGSKQTDIVETTLKHLAQLDDTNKRSFATEKLSEDLKTLQFLLYGDPDHEADAEEVKKLTPLILETDKNGHNLFYKLCKYMKELPFEAKKQAAQVICFMVRRCNKNDLPEYLQNHKDIFQFLIEGFEDHQLAQHAGSVLQEMAKRSEIGVMLFDIPCHFNKLSSTIIFKPSSLTKSTSLFMDNCFQKTKKGEEKKASFFFLPLPEIKKKKLINNRDALAKMVAEESKAAEAESDRSDANTKSTNEDVKKDEANATDAQKNGCLEITTQDSGGIETTLTAKDIITQLFIYAHNPNMIIASDAFEVLSILLNKHESRSKRYIEEHFEEVISYFNGSVMSENYVTQGKFLKLLGDVLLSKHNSKIRLMYITDRNNLRIFMTLLKNTSRLISYESFHVFKLFVVNPAKSDDVHIILFKNREKLVKLLEEFQTQRGETDAEFRREKEIVIEHLKNMEKPQIQEKKT
ncbi:hypothetical protein RFI_21664 [Reticulomyxa filosa]|uniref:Calcium binding protein 39 n=1 Tax=Reticulomyxa filosa TaxID=46433 RepID=X6MNY0_RETFI|nr:hypothetical protein RFI_21664 [Reticulomyxa filosa]|eukprot:ETO15708.1 hypothetical protein RFI_21664 [Reticulomyxa filosa]